MCPSSPADYKLAGVLAYSGQLSPDPSSGMLVPGRARGFNYK